MNRLALLISVLTFLYSCSSEEEVIEKSEFRDYTAITENFGDKIDPDNLFDYENQTVPNYITKDNSGNNPITNEGATLGRVLFYDTNLSIDNSVSCASCHQQSNAFGDLKLVSDGVNGVTGRHSMRLVNTRFSNETRFFWDERATSLENQTTRPIQDHVEMGFSGEDGNPDISDLIEKLGAIDYYPELFHLAFGDTVITEARMQLAIAQFIRSIQSFDSKFDEGISQVNNVNADFANYSDQENLGKQLFLDPPNMDGAGCAGCHRVPEFDIDPQSGNNGVIGVANSNEQDLTNTRAPSLRDLFNISGELNGPLMHDGSFTSLLDVINHYNSIPEESANENLDNKLMPRGNLQQLNLSEAEKESIVAFVKTLSGSEIYTAGQWSDPFN